MQVTAQQLKRIAVGNPVMANVNSIVSALNLYGAEYGLDQPHRLAHYLSQLAHESGSFRYDKEIASGAAYEGRKDLGNTKKGDGKRFKGRGPIQITGRANYRAFAKWAKKLDPDAPDFEANPDAVNTDPWEGLAPIWYWDEGNPDPQERSLNYYADSNNIEMVTRRINGGINGLEERIRFYDRAALILLGYPTPSWKQLKNDPAIKKFQEDAVKAGYYRKANVDGQTGPLTRAAMHQALVALANTKELSKDVAKAPVVEVEEKEVEVKVPVKVPEAVKVPALEKPWYKDFQGIKELVTGFGATGLAAAAGIPWQTIAIIGGVFLLSGAAWYLIRRNDQAKQEAQVQQIEARAATAEAKIANA